VSIRTGAAAVLLLLLVAAHPPGDAEAGRSPLAFRCPKPVAASAAARPEAVLTAARRLVPREYARLSSMGRPAWPGFRVMGAVPLFEPPFVPALRRLAVRLCGSRAANRSWAVFIYFPNCQMPCSVDAALIARTARGWRFWHSAFRHP
jgi:hypothetical protein